jgi:hypothetical protein
VNYGRSKTLTTNHRLREDSYSLDVKTVFHDLTYSIAGHAYASHIVSRVSLGGDVVLGEARLSGCCGNNSKPLSEVNTHRPSRSFNAAAVPMRLPSTIDTRQVHIPHYFLWPRSRVCLARSIDRCDFVCTCPSGRVAAGRRSPPTHLVLYHRGLEGGRLIFTHTISPARPTALYNICRVGSHLSYHSDDSARYELLEHAAHTTGPPDHLALAVATILDRFKRIFCFLRRLEPVPA